MTEAVTRFRPTDLPLLLLVAGAALLDALRLLAVNGLALVLLLMGWRPPCTQRPCQLLWPAQRPVNDHQLRAAGSAFPRSQFLLPGSRDRARPCP